MRLTWDSVATPLTTGESRVGCSCRTLSKIPTTTSVISTEESDLEDVFLDITGNGNGKSNGKAPMR